MHIMEEYPGLKRALGALALVAAAAVLGFLLFALGKDLALWVFGEPAKAVIVDRWAEPVGETGQGELSFRYYVQYRFKTPSGKVVTSVKSVAVQEWVGVSQGRQGRASVDTYDGEAEGPAAPVYQEQEHLTEFNAGGLSTAGEVTIVYFPLLPGHNRLEESRFIPLLACTYVPLLIAGGTLLLIARQLLRRESPAARWHAERRGEVWQFRAVGDRTTS